MEETTEEQEEQQESEWQARSRRICDDGLRDCGTDSKGEFRMPVPEPKEAVKRDSERVGAAAF